MRGAHAMGIVTDLRLSVTDTKIIFNINAIFSLLVHTYLPSATRQGIIFTGVCQSFCSQGAVWQPPPPRQTPTGQAAPLCRHPPGQTPLPVHAGIHPPGGHCSGRYASY